MRSWRAAGEAVVLCALLGLSACSGGGSDPPGAQDMSADQGVDMAAASDLGADQGAEDMGAEDMADPLVTLPPEPWDLAARGHYNVGVYQETITYTDSVGDERKLRTVWWFPTRHKEGKSFRYAGLFEAPGVLRDVPVIDSPARLPVLVYSHGSQGFAEQSYFFTEHFASHGFVVVAPDHAGNTFLAGANADTTVHALLRPQDIRATLDHLDTLATDHPLAGRLSEDLVLSGYSYGGYTALALGGGAYGLDVHEAECAGQDPQSARCALMLGHKDTFEAGFADARVKLLLAQAPGGSTYLKGGLGGITTPTLLTTGGRDLSLPNESVGDPYWAQLSGSQHLRVDLTDAGHNAQSDVCDYNGRVLLATGACDEEMMDFGLAHTIINHYSLAFVRYHMMGDDAQAALLNGDAPYAQMTVSRNGDAVTRKP